MKFNNKYCSLLLWANSLSTPWLGQGGECQICCWGVLLLGSMGWNWVGLSHRAVAGGCRRFGEQSTWSGSIVAVEHTCEDRCFYFFRHLSSYGQL